MPFDVKWVARESPILHAMDVAVLDGVMVNVIESMPVISLGTKTAIPMIMPNLTSASLVQPIQVMRCTSMPAFNKALEFQPGIAFHQNMIMVIKDDPRIQL